MDTADARAGRRYVQQWRDNMTQRGEPVLTPLEPSSREHTRVSFLPDSGLALTLGVSPNPSLALSLALTLALTLTR